MPQLNFNALVPEGPQGVLQGFMQGRAMQQREQQAQQQAQQAAQALEVNQMKLEALKRDKMELSQLQERLAAMGQDPDPEKFLSTMIQHGQATGNLDLINKGLEGRQKYAEIRRAEGLLRRYAPELYGEAPAAAPAAASAAPAAPAMGTAPGMLGSGTFGMVEPANALAPAAAPAAPANALAPAAADPVSALRMQIMALRSANDPRTKALADIKQAELAELLKTQVVSPGQRVLRGGQVVFEAPERPEATPAEIRAYEYAKNVDGFRGTFLDFKRSIAEAGRAPATPPTPAAPVAVVDPATGKTVFVTREEAISGRMTPASAIEGLSPKEIQKREATLPQARQAVSTVSNTMSTIESTIERLLANEAGLNGVTGLIGGRTPAITDAARKAEADLEQLRNLAFVQGLTELRAASKTGAGVGSVSNREGDRFENLKSSLKQTQSFKDMRDSLIRLRENARTTKQVLKDAFDETYSYRQSGAGQPGTAAPTDGVDTNNPLLKK